MDKSFITDHTDDEVLKAMREIRDEELGIRIAMREIADKVGCHINTVKNSISRLEQKKLLRVYNRKGKPTSYEILDNTPPAL